MSSRGPVVSRSSDVFLYATPFDPTTLSPARRHVRQSSMTVGLAGQRLDDFTIAVGEILANTAIHGGGTGNLELRTGTARLRCRITDHGPGLPEGFTLSCPADPRAHSGRGLWIAHLLCDRVSWRSSRHGTLVELTVVLS